MPWGNEWHAKTLGNGSWEEVLAAIDCNYYAISNPASQGFDKCSDPSDPQTVENIGGGGNFVIRSPFTGGRTWDAVRWKAGEHITYVKSSSPLDLYFLR